MAIPKSVLHRNPVNSSVDTNPESGAGVAGSVNYSSPVATPKHAHVAKFVEATASNFKTHSRLIIDLAGEEKTGKTHFAFTCPAPIFEHSFDIGNEGVIDKFLLKKKIMVAEYELEVQPDSDAGAREVAECANRLWEQFVSNFRDGLASCGNGTTMIDTGTEMWELLRLARFGKLTQIMPQQYTAVNKEMQSLIRECYNHNGSTIFLTKMKPEWENYKDANGRDKSRKTGSMERSGFKDMPFQVQVVATCNREDQEEGGSVFSVTIDSCRQNPEMNNATIENADFDTLASLVLG